MNSITAQTLDPPTNVVAVQENNAIRLNWIDPINEGYNRPALSWNTSDVDTVGGSIASLYPLFVGARFDFSSFNFNNHVGRKVKSVDIYAENPNNLCTFKLQIFRCTTYSNYNIVKVYEQPFTLASQGNHTIVDLTSDFYITPYFVFYTFGYEVINPDNAAIPIFGMDEGPNVYRRGDILHTPNHFSSGWNYLAEAGSLFGIYMNANFIIKVILSEKYNVYRDGALIATVFEPTFLDTTAEPNQQYCYTVKTVYVNSLSSSSNQTCITKTANYSTPENYSYTLNNCKPIFTWIPINSSENDGTFNDYRIYKNGVLLGNTTDTFFVDNQASIGNYVYCVSATYISNYTIQESFNSCIYVSLNTPTISITGDTSICLGENTILTANSSESNYLWSNGSINNSITVSPLSTTTYYVSTSNTDGCINTDSITVFVHENPDVTITPNSQICLGETITINANGGVNYLWNTGATTNEINVSPLFTTIYNVIVTNEFGCSTDTSITIFVQNPPIITKSSDTTICKNQSAILSANGDGTIYWSNGNTENQITVSPEQTTTYYVTITNQYNCSAIDSITVFINPIPNLNITGNFILCYNDSTTLKVSGGNNYLWNNGSSNNSIIVSPLVTTSYSVTASNEYNCSKTETITVIVNELPTVSIQGNTTICYGESTTLSAQTTATTFEWSNGATTQDITVNPTETTTYSVIVTDENGCSNSTEITVIVNELPTVAIYGNTTICYGESTTLFAQTTATVFEWNNGSTTQEITINPTETTTYLVTVIYENGCSNSTEITVIVNELPTVSIQGNTIICYGETTTLSAQTTAPTFEWSNGSTTQEITVNPTETTTYSVIVTYENGCSNSTEITVIVNELPTVSIQGNTTICYGESTTLSAQTTATVFEWSNGATTQEITVNPTETTTYSVIVTYENGCSNSTEITVIVNELPIVSIQGNTTICYGESTILFAQTTATVFEWNNGATTQEITVNPIETTTYSVIVTDENGCSNSIEITVIVNELPTVSIQGNTILCIGESTTLSAQTTATVFKWSNGATTQEITINPTETTTYSVTVTDENGCSNSTEITVIVNESPTVSIQGNTTICYGESTTLSAQTTATVFEWSDGATTQEITVNPTETTTYSVTVTDENGCSNSTEITVIVNELPTVSIQGNTTICYGESTTFSAQTTATVFEWSNGATTQEITVNPLETTTYSVIVTDANGCSNSTEITVIVNELPTVSIQGNTTICYGESTTLFAQTTATVFEWSDGATTQEITVNPLETTTYSVIVTDANGCSNSTEITVIVNELPIVSIQGNTTICYGESTTLSAQTAATVFEWSNGATTQEITANPTETTTYSVTVIDENGCSNSTEITVIVNELPSVSIQGNTTICYGESTTLFAQTTATVFEWSNGATTQEITVNPTETTIYSVIVTDENGCSNSTEITVIVNELPTVSIQGNTTICYGESTTLSAQTTATTFEWNNGVTTQEITINPTETTTYSVTVIDENGCSNSTEITVIVNELPTVAIYGNTTICYGESTTLFAQTTATVFEWSNGATTQEITVNPTETTTYSVIVTDENGCSNSTEITVIVNELPTISIQGNTIICIGESTTLSAQTIATVFEWSNGSTTQEITVNPTETSTYSVIVIDENGCSNSQTITIEVINPTVPIDFTANNNNGTIYLSWEGEGEQYNIYKDNQYLTTVLEKYFMDGDIQPYVLYCYHISSIVENCESDKTEVQCISTPSNLELKKNKYSIHPNPTNDYFVIQGDNIIKIEIINALGQSVFIKDYSITDYIKISINNYTSSVYFVRIYNNIGEIIVRQLIVY